MVVVNDFFNPLIYPRFLFPYLQFSPVEGVIFADYGTDLGSGSLVPGWSATFLPFCWTWTFSMLYLFSCFLKVINITSDGPQVTKFYTRRKRKERRPGWYFTMSV